MLYFASLFVAILVIIAQIAGQRRATKIAAGDPHSLHSRPNYHGLKCALWTGLVGFSILIVASIASRQLIDAQLRSSLPSEAQEYANIKIDRLIRDAKAVGDGSIVSRPLDAKYEAARDELAAQYVALKSLREWGITIAAILASVSVFLLTYRSISKQSRARNSSEAHHPRCPLRLRRYCDPDYNRNPVFASRRNDQILQPCTIIQVPFRNALVTAFRRVRRRG